MPKSRMITAFVVMIMATRCAMAEEHDRFTIAVSEYPSWSGTFLTAGDLGLINGMAGKLGPLETKWNVDVVVQETDYDSCIKLFVNGAVDAACLTNIDSLAPSVARHAVAILPTSTSVGADACLVGPDVATVKDLKNIQVHGLAASVSQYAFDKGLQALGEDAKQYRFENFDPLLIGVALLNGSIKAGMTWNPVVLETLTANAKIRRLFDSSLIPGHIVDMVTASRDSLKKPGGKAFGAAVADIYYTIGNLMENPATRDQTLTSMGKRFFNLSLENMRTIVRETRFYSTPEQGLALFKGADLSKVMTDHVVPWALEKGIIDKNKPPKIAFGDDPSANLCFDSQYIEAVAKK